MERDTVSLGARQLVSELGSGYTGRRRVPSRRSGAGTIPWRRRDPRPSSRWSSARCSATSSRTRRTRPACRASGTRKRARRRDGGAYLGELCFDDVSTPAHEDRATTVGKALGRGLARRARGGGVPTSRSGATRACMLSSWAIRWAVCRSWVAGYDPWTVRAARFRRPRSSLSAVPGATAGSVVTYGPSNVFRHRRRGSRPHPGGSTGGRVGRPGGSPLRGPDRSRISEVSPTPSLGGVPRPDAAAVFHAASGCRRGPARAERNGVRLRSATNIAAFGRVPVRRFALAGLVLAAFTDPARDRFRRRAGVGQGPRPRERLPAAFRCQRGSTSTGKSGLRDRSSDPGDSGAAAHSDQRHQDQEHDRRVQRCKADASPGCSPTWRVSPHRRAPSSGTTES